MALVGTHPLITDLKEKLAIIAKKKIPIPVLVVGEHGTGKEEVVKELAFLSDKKIFATNCAAIPSELLESELFGHTRGSFTGAVDTKIGLFEAAGNNIVFLDEIGDLPEKLQAKLLRVLQERVINRVGSLQQIAINCCVVSATNKNISTLITESKFREDLYYRLNALLLRLPPLNTLKSHLHEYIEHFLKLFNEKYQTSYTHISEKSINSLNNYSFPGNFRQLRNLIEEAIVLSSNDDNKELTLREVQIELPLALNKLRKSNRQLLISALEQTGYQQNKAAELLGITKRAMNHQVKIHGITHDTWRTHKWSKIQCEPQ